MGIFGIFASLEEKEKKRKLAIMKKIVKRIKKGVKIQPATEEEMEQHRRKEERQKFLYRIDCKFWNGDELAESVELTEEERTSMLEHLENRADGGRLFEKFETLAKIYKLRNFLIKDEWTVLQIERLWEFAKTKERWMVYHYPNAFPEVPNE